MEILPKWEMLFPQLSNLAPRGCIDREDLAYGCVLNVRCKLTRDVISHQTDIL